MPHFCDTPQVDMRCYEDSVFAAQTPVSQPHTEHSTDLLLYCDETLRVFPPGVLDLMTSLKWYVRSTYGGFGDIIDQMFDIMDKIIGVIRYTQFERFDMFSHEDAVVLLYVIWKHSRVSSTGCLLRHGVACLYILYSYHGVETSYPFSFFVQPLGCAKGSILMPAVLKIIATKGVTEALLDFLRAPAHTLRYIRAELETYYK